MVARLRLAISRSVRFGHLDGCGDEGLIKAVPVKDDEYGTVDKWMVRRTQARREAGT